VSNSTKPKSANRISFTPNIYWLLAFLPVALFAQNDILAFVASGLAIVPLAALIGQATETLAARLGPGLGGLINATLGNAAELIITIFALRAGYVELVKASLIGSIMGNLLLVAGFSFLLGGLRNGSQTFDRRAASINATLVILAFMALAIPSGFDEAITATGGPGRELFFSEGIALVMIILYGLYLLYSLRAPKQALENTLKEATQEIHLAGMSMRRALVMLALATLGIVFMSEVLVGTVEPVGRSLGLSEFFIGIIIVPLIGNVAEHVVALQVAIKNRMDLSMGIALGSSLQVALFVAPVLVFISLLFEKKLVLVFTPYEIIALATASVVTALVSQDGESNWMEGAILLAVYTILGLAFFLLPSVAH
jgi:Ca2+:H+ antiporter